MPHTLIYGKINFCQKQDKEQLKNFAYDMILKSVEHRFGLKFCANISSYTKQKTDMRDWITGSALSYEITDNPLSNECCDIYEGIWIGRDDLVGVENSRLMDLQRFVSAIVVTSTVESIEFCTRDVHGDCRAGETSYTIKVDELCHVLTTAPRLYTEIPNVNILIVK